MAQTKYITLSKLSTFLDNLSNKFSALSHTHTMKDVLDFEIDDQLSDVSTNPVQNKVLNDEFEAISKAMEALDFTIESKADSEHSHDNAYYTKTQVNDALAKKSHVQIITWGADD